MCCKPFGRREFLGRAAGLLATAGVAAGAGGRAPRAAWSRDRWDPDRPFARGGASLRVQPILIYAVPRRAEAASWKSWGGVQSEASAVEEAARITRELGEVASRADFPLEVLPVARVLTAEDAARAGSVARDVTLVYPASGSGGILRQCVPDRGDTLIFVRHRSGPIYYWYEALSTRQLACDRAPGAGAPADAAAPAIPNVSVHDVVVDDGAELLTRLRALRAVKSLLGTRAVALGGTWGKYDPEAVARAIERFRLQVVDVPYADLEARLEDALRDPSTMAVAEAWTERFLSVPATALSTDRKSVIHAFVLYGLFKDLMEEHGASTFTIKDCMRTIMPMSGTTACLTLGLLSDEGLLAFCESDFVILPAGILLRHLTGTPAFLHNSTFPHPGPDGEGIVTCAHCAAPRRMDGRRYEPVRIVTHYESEYGAAPKVEMPLGQDVTFIDPEYSSGRWIGFRGNVEGNPAYEICRSQQDVRIGGSWRRLIHEVRDSHWVMAYGNHLAALAHATRKLGLQWVDMSDS